MKVLLVTMYWPPAGGGGVQRPLKLAFPAPAPDSPMVEVDGARLTFKRDA